MQNSDKLNKNKEDISFAIVFDKKGCRCLLVAGNFAHFKKINEMLFLDYRPGPRRTIVVLLLGPGSRQCCAFSRLLP